MEKDFLATSGLLRQAAPDGEKPQSSTECGVPFDGGKVMISGLEAEEFSAMHTHFPTRESALKKVAMSAAHVGEASAAMAGSGPANSP